MVPRHGCNHVRDHGAPQLNIPAGSEVDCFDIVHEILSAAPVSKAPTVCQGRSP